MNRLLPILLTLAACKGDEPVKPVAPVTATIDPLELRCVEWGAAHYKAIGSYPTLTDGSSADGEAKARCQRSIDAYPNPEIAETERAIAEIERQLGGPATVMSDIHNRIGSLRGPEKTKAEAALAAARAEWDPGFKKLRNLKTRLAHLRAEAK